MDPRDWEAQEPPDDFADRVMARIERDAEAPRRARARRLAVAGGLALAASVALAIGWHATAAPSRGEAIARDREQVALGARATAVLEPGAKVAWVGDEVTQPAGDVFYRVEPGGSFRVHTPAGDVQVLGTCFRVRVQGTEDDVNRRDVKAGAIGAALSAVAFVSVYEGKVAVSRASESVSITAGESARADANGVHRAAASEPEGAAGAGGASAAASGDEPLLAANANLADAVREYKQRLEAIEAQKKGVEKQLAEVQTKLAASENDGQIPVSRDDFDLSQDDWKQLAARGEVRAKLPCMQPDQWTFSPEQLTKMGLAPQDAQPLHEAFQRSYDRTWATVRPLCVQALGGSASTADLLGPGTCQSLVFQAAQKNKENTDEEMRIVAEIRAGMRPANAVDDLGPAGKMLYQLSGESTALERDLGQSIGPDDAHRFVQGDEGCWSRSAWSSGPRPPLPGK